MIQLLKGEGLPLFEVLDFHFSGWASSDMVQEVLIAVEGDLGYDDL